MIPLFFTLSYFNSHAHVERDLLFHLEQMYHIISTHTLMWSVTSRPNTCDICSDISTHTLTWSVTCRHNRNTPNHAISTHTLTWSVTFEQIKERLTCVISTHTLTWSVTRRTWQSRDRRNRFQLTRSRGA